MAVNMVRLFNNMKVKLKAELKAEILEELRAELKPKTKATKAKGDEVDGGQKKSTVRKTKATSNESE